MGGQFVAPEFPVFVEMFRVGHLVAQVGQKAAFDRIQVFDVFVYQFESPLQRTPAAAFPVSRDALLLLVAHEIEAGAHQVFLVSEHFIEGALRDSQRLRDLIHPDGTDAVPGNELLRDADDLLFGRSPFHYFASAAMSRPPPRAW